MFRIIFFVFIEKLKTFRPLHRFSPENKEKITEYTFLPFGAGPRACIGIRLALLEVKSTIVTVLQKYQLVTTQELEVKVLKH